jgi:hypothetical protein
MADGAGTTSPEGSDPTGEAPTVEELAELCAMQTDRDSCHAVPSLDNSQDGNFYWCVWHAWVPVTLTDHGCVFDEPEAGCIMEWTSTVGCESPEACGTLHHVGFREGERGRVEIARVWDGCFPPGQPCSFPSDATPEPPECGCACDRDFPD